MSVERIEIAADPEVIAAWREHFASPTENDPNWLTLRELAEIAGLGPSTMKVRIRQGLKDGTYITSNGRRRRTDGQLIQLPVYKLVTKPKAAKRGRK